MKYRADIDGLRAIAVLIVILFHFGVPGFAGGFIGVDIFFVLSGYLIGSIILKQLDQERFSFIQFYFRRFRRLMPAFAIVMVVSFILGYWLMLPKDFTDFGQSLAAATVYLSNFLFYREAGYFDTASHLKPLLHTWTLAVEEQFYIVFPALAWIIFRIKRNWLQVIFFALTIISLFASILYLPKDASAVFYLYPFRAWEMFIGVLFVAGSLPMIRRSLYINLLALVGILLILVPTLLYTSKTPFPGLAALPPCLGTVILIYCGMSSNSIINKWLTNSIAVFIGKISYSLYLWHWPLYVFYVYDKTENITALEIVFLLVVTFIAATLSWRFVETPYREGKMVLSKNVLSVFATTGVVSTIFVSMGVYLHISKGVPQRLNPDTAKFASAAGDLFGDLSGCSRIGNQRIPELEFCEVNDGFDADKYTLIWSDSHGGAFKSGYEFANLKEQQSAVIAWTGGCAPVFGIDKDESVSSQATDEKCRSRNAAIKHLLHTDKRIDKLVMLGRWSYYYTGQGVGVDDNNKIEIWSVDGQRPVKDQSIFFLNSIQNTVSELNNIGFQPFIIEQVPEFPNYLARQLALGFIKNKSEVVNNIEQLTTVSYSEVTKRQGAVRALFEKLSNAGKINLIETHKFFCDAITCSLMIDGKPAYFDNNHISTYGAGKLSPMFDELLKR